MVGVGACGIGDADGVQAGDEAGELQCFVDAEGVVGTGIPAAHREGLADAGVGHLVAQSGRHLGRAARGRRPRLPTPGRPGGTTWMWVSIIVHPPLISDCRLQIAD